jgi:uncharacterized protein YxjI
MGLRERREQRRQERETFGRRGNARQYLMRQKLLSFGDDYWMEDDAGKRVLRVDGKALRLRHTLDIEDDRGAKVCRIHTRVQRNGSHDSGTGGQACAHRKIAVCADHTYIQRPARALDCAL